MGSAIETPGYWMDGVWQGLTGPAGTYSAGVTCLAVSGGNVYAGGWCEVDAGSGNFARVVGYWLNGVWTPLSPPASTEWWDIGGLVVSGGSVYAPGNEGGSVAGYWMNGTWTLLPSSGLASNATSIAVSAGDVYVGGWVASRGPSTTVPGYWKNGVWTGFPGFIFSTLSAEVNAIFVFCPDVLRGWNGAADVLRQYTEAGMKDAIWRRS